ncbi:MAG: RNase adapter protein RapZ [Actinomycetota bacterium]|nr:RNase adapter protein RapZ [Actinomycetota bacterium]
MSSVVLVTGLSGAGRSQAGNVFEDMGWFVIDNLPTELLDKVIDLVVAKGSSIDKVALVMHTAGSGDDLSAAMATMRTIVDDVRVLFLDAADDVLVRRYEDTRRRHPLGEGQRVVESIVAERDSLEPLKAEADVVIDTSELNVHQLRDRITDLFGGDRPQGGMQTTVMSFGYKHGLPLDVDMVLDCRFLPNPHWVDELRSKTGRDKAVRRYVLDNPQTGAFLERLEGLFDILLPGYVAEGKSYLTIAIGCTGGRHRSVVIADELAGRLRKRGIEPRVLHRDIKR